MKCVWDRLMLWPSLKLIKKFSFRNRRESSKTYLEMYWRKIGWKLRPQCKVRGNLFNSKASIRSNLMKIFSSFRALQSKTIDIYIFE